MMKTLVLIFSLLILLPGCDSEEESNIERESPVLMDNDLYHSAASDDFDFSEVKINGDSLKAVIRYGGGCREVELQLVGSEDVLDSDPPQRNIQLILEDNDPCEALVEEIFYFDLTPVRVSGNDRVQLNLSDWDPPLLYEY